MAVDEQYAQVLRENESMRAALRDLPTVRDQFAMVILQGLCANPGAVFQANDRSGWGMVNCTDKDLALTVYAMADAVMAVRAASGVDVPQGQEKDRG